MIRRGMVVLLSLLLSGCALDLRGELDASEDVPDITLEVPIDVSDVPDVMAEEIVSEDVEIEITDVDVPIDTLDVPDVMAEEIVSEDVETEDVEPEFEDVIAEDVETEKADIEADDIEEISEIEEEEIDPCPPPSPILNPVHIFFCFNSDITAEFNLWRRVDRESGDIPWGLEDGCTASESRSFDCIMTDYGVDAIVYFNIEIPGVGIGWACGPGLTTPHGQPRVWFNGTELSLEVVDSGGGRCDWKFTIPW